MTAVWIQICEQAAIAKLKMTSVDIKIFNTVKLSECFSCTIKVIELKSLTVENGYCFLGLISFRNINMQDTSSGVVVPGVEKWAYS